MVNLWGPGNAVMLSGLEFNDYVIMLKRPFIGQVGVIGTYIFKSLKPIIITIKGRSYGFETNEFSLLARKRA